MIEEYSFYEAIKDSNFGNEVNFESLQREEDDKMPLWEIPISKLSNMSNELSIPPTFDKDIVE